MGTFNTSKILYVSPAYIPAMAERLCRDFQADGYDVASDNLMSGGIEVSISKGGVFKSALGMKTALKISLTPREESVVFDASVGIFGKQIIPALLAWYVAWPVLLTQVWGLITQSKLDDKALAIVMDVASSGDISVDAPTSPIEKSDTRGEYCFCTHCGHKNLITADKCSSCGKDL